MIMHFVIGFRTMALGLRFVCRPRAINQMRGILLKAHDFEVLPVLGLQLNTMAQYGCPPDAGC